MYPKPKSQITLAKQPTRLNGLEVNIRGQLRRGFGLSYVEHREPESFRVVQARLGVRAPRAHHGIQEV